MGKDLIFTHADGSTFPVNKRSECTFLKSATQSVSALSEDVVDIVVNSANVVDFRIGDKTYVFGRPYWLNQAATMVKEGENRFEYSLHLEGMQYQLARAAYNINIDTTGSDLTSESLTTDLRGFLDVLIANAERVIPGRFVLGNVPENTETKTLTFGDKDNCLAVLQRLCQEYKVDFTLTPSLNIFILDIDKAGDLFPYTFKFGRGRGIYQLKREKVSDANIVNRLMVYGSTRNITSKYRSSRLLLPNCNKSQSFVEDKESIAKYGVWENSKTFDDIYPQRTGKAFPVEGSIVEFTDPSMNFDLNEKEEDGKTTKWLIPGTSAKVHFNTGPLAGMEFEIASYDHTSKKFKIIPFEDENGFEFPSKTSTAFRITQGNDYVLIDINLPDVYINNAESKLIEEGRKYLKENAWPKVKYSLSLSAMFIEKMMHRYETDLFWPGDMVHIQDAEIGVDRAIRVTGFKRDVINPSQYTLTIADGSYEMTIVERIIDDINNHDRIIEIHDLKDPAKARRNWRDSQELLNMVFDPEGDYFTDKIKPESIETTMLSVGAKSMQFGIEEMIFEPNYTGQANRINVSDGYLVHYTIDAEKARRWTVLGVRNALINQHAPGKTIDDTAFYIYARCPIADGVANIVFETEPKAFNADPLYYYFWIGVLNSVDKDMKVRSISLTYGFTAINGRFVKTGRVQSADGVTYFDLDDGEIGGRIVFTRNDEKRTLEELGAESLANKNYIENTLPGIFGNFSEQIDGKIETWFQKEDPSVNWTMQMERLRHVGDIWFKTDTKESKRYSNTFAWELIEDKDAQKALEDASNAQDTADKKRRIFTETPTTPYDPGDLWVQGLTGDIMVSNVLRTEKEVFNSSDWFRASKYTGDENLMDFIQNTYNAAISDIYSQLDGVIETWFNTGVPTLTNYPAMDWKTNEDKTLHLGDIYYDNHSGLGYRFSKMEDGSFAWVEITDSGLMEALDAAKKAQDTADGKRRTFTGSANPVPPYDPGDLWASGTFLKMCVKEKAEKTKYDAADWTDATEYTGDENLNAFVDGVFETTISDLYNQIDGKLESWYTTTDPSSSWKTNDERKKHVGDLWFNTSANTLWRYTMNGTSPILFGWSQIHDAAAINAAKKAKEASDTADGKRRVFVDIPVPPYDPGDLWAEGPDGDLWRCNTKREDGESYNVMRDFGKATKYTDDGALIDFINTTYSPDIAGILNQIDGKIESWFQESDPAENWKDNATKDKHVGDTWFSPMDNILRFYVLTGVEGFVKYVASGKRFYIGDYTPTSSTYPEEEWTDQQTRQSHIGDLYYDRAKNVLYQYSAKISMYASLHLSYCWSPVGDENTGTLTRNIADLCLSNNVKIFTTTTPSYYSKNDVYIENGRIRVAMIGNINYVASDWIEKVKNTFYMWQRSYDQNALDAYAAASQAQDTADGKRRVFIETPYPPYDEGDLWTDGMDLRRCCHSRAEGEQYNVDDDWEKAVNYDNTKTIIDGGIVTSGTIQVAGLNQTIQAGMTGEGTTDDSVRFWAGKGFGQRNAAPFRVLHNGKSFLKDTEVEGKVTATSGSIGGFEIANNRIGVEGKDASGNHVNKDGLSIIPDFIKYSINKGTSESRWAGIGSNVYPLSTGFPCLSRFEYRDGYVDDHAAVALRAVCRPNKKSWFKTQRAIDYDGNVFGIGQHADFYDGYIGPCEDPDVISRWLEKTTRFYFTSIMEPHPGDPAIPLQLPTWQQINSVVGNRAVGFDIEIVVGRGVANKIRLQSRKDAEMYLSNDRYLQNIDLDASNIIVITYINGSYIIKYKNF